MPIKPKTPEAASVLEDEHDEDDESLPSILRLASESSNIHFYNHPISIEIKHDEDKEYIKTKRRFNLSEVGFRTEVISTPDKDNPDITHNKPGDLFGVYRSENSTLNKVLQPYSAMLSGDFMEGNIAEFCLSLEQICSKASIKGQTVIPIYIDSFGGDVYSMLKVLDTMQALRETYGVKFATIAQGKAMSAGAFTLMFGDIGYRYATPRATVMIHDISTFMGGRMSEIHTSYKETERLSNTIMGSLSDYITQGADSKYLKKLLEKTKHTDLFLTADEAVELKVVDYVGIPQFSFELTLKEKITPVIQDGIWKTSFGNKKTKK